MKQETNDNFVVLRREVLEDTSLTPSEKLVYARICSFKTYFECKEKCAELLGISKDTVVKAKQNLLRLNYIRVVNNTGHGKIYQSIYDYDSRLVKSTNQIGKKHPIRLVKSTNIEEIENKYNSKGSVRAKSKDKQLLEILNRVTNRKFRVLPLGYKKTLKVFTLEEIEQALNNLVKNNWYKDRLSQFGSEYFLRDSTIDRFLSVEDNQKPETVNKPEEFTSKYLAEKGIL